MENFIGVALYAAALIAAFWILGRREQGIKSRGKEIQAGVLTRYGVALPDEFCASFSREHTEGGSRGKVHQGTTMAELADGTLATVMVRGRENPSVYRKAGDDWVPLAELEKAGA